MDDVATLILIAVSQLLQRILDAGRSDLPYPVFLLCRLGIDVDDAVTKLERHAATLGSRGGEMKAAGRGG